MKADYSIASAKSMITRNRGKFEGKQIIIPPPGPGIKMWGAIDFLKTKGYIYNPVPFKPRKKKSFFKQRLEVLNELRNMIIEAVTKEE